jgi:aminoglycoside phosphotransferase (APT) family kinase protein
VLSLLEDATPLVEAFGRCTPTLAHGDLATVNMCFEGDTLVLLDWAMPAAAPGALDVTRFLVGCAHVVEPTRDEFLQMYADAAGPAYDETAMRLALLSGLIWLGWNKTHDIVESRDPAHRARERVDLDWWVAQARTTLESGVL